MEGVEGGDAGGGVRENGETDWCRASKGKGEDAGLMRKRRLDYFFFSLKSCLFK